MTMKYIKDLNIDEKMCKTMLADDFFDPDNNVKKDEDIDKNEE